MAQPRTGVPFGMGVNSRLRQTIEPDLKGLVVVERTVVERRSESMSGPVVYKRLVPDSGSSSLHPLRTTSGASERKTPNRVNRSHGRRPRQESAVPCRADHPSLSFPSAPTIINSEHAPSPVLNAHLLALLVASRPSDGPYQGAS